MLRNIRILLSIAALSLAMVPSIVQASSVLEQCVPDASHDVAKEKLLQSKSRLDRDADIVAAQNRILKDWLSTATPNALRSVWGDPMEDEIGQYWFIPRQVEMRLSPEFFSNEKGWLCAYRWGSVAVWEIRFEGDRPRMRLVVGRSGTPPHAHLDTDNWHERIVQ